MHKNGFTIIEVVVVFLLILGVTFLTLPKNIETTKQARFISRWTQKYSDLEYVFSVIKAQKDGEITQKISEAKDNNDVEKVIIDALRPYLRITEKINVPYKQNYMNGKEVTDTSKYYIENFYLTNSYELLGLKLINLNCQKDETCMIMSFDINGTTLPNKWGYDIFGINILRQKITPLGENVDFEELRNDCSKRGSGFYCSYYYLMGGKFD